MLTHNSTGGMYTVHFSWKILSQESPVSPMFLLLSLHQSWGREAGACFPHLSFCELQSWCVNTFDLGRITWVCWLTQSSTWPSNEHLQPQKPIMSWARASKAAWPAGTGRGFCSSALLWWDPTQNPASSPGVSNTRTMWTCWSRSKAGP